MKQAVWRKYNRAWPEPGRSHEATKRISPGSYHLLAGFGSVYPSRTFWEVTTTDTAVAIGPCLHQMAPLPSPAYFPLRFFAHRNFCAIEILRRAAADIFQPLRRPRRGPGLPCPFNAPIAAVIACNSRVAASCLASASFAALRSIFKMFIQKPSHRTVPQTMPGPRCPKAASTFCADSLV